MDVSSDEAKKLEAQFGAHNYKPIPVVIHKAEGIWVYDPEGKKYLDCLSAYSAVNQGHRHPRIIQALKDQADVLTLTSRAFYNDKLGIFLKKLCNYADFEMALPMNTGAEAVETAIKMARRWGYEQKKVPKDRAEIIVAADNFHGRTTTIVGFSTDPDAYEGYGPKTPGFIIVPYNNASAIEKAITKNTVAVLVEPIQGEAGVIIPNKGYLKQIREACTKNNVLMILDEIQTGFCRTGKKFAFQHENIKPDAITVGKALGGGCIPVSAVLSSRKLLEVFTPGTHGSTFGGNPLACAVGMAAIDVLIDENLDKQAEEMGKYFKDKLLGLQKKSSIIKEVRGIGLLIAIEIIRDKNFKARQITEKLMENGILAKETHEYTIRFAPPLVIKKEDIDWAYSVIEKVILSFT